MAVIKTVCRVDSSTNLLADIKAALQAKSLITSVLFEDSQNLIFSTPLISTKVIKIYCATARGTFYIQYGDAWTSGSTITNATYITYSYNNGAGYYLSSVYIYTDTTHFIIICPTTSNGSMNPIFCYVGSLDNSDAVAIGLSLSSGNAINNVGYNFSKTRAVTSFSFYTSIGFKDGNSKIVTIPFLLMSTTGVLEMNGTVPAEVIGLKMSSVTGVASNTLGGGVGYDVLPSVCYCNGVQITATSPLIEYTS